MFKVKTKTGTVDDVLKNDDCKQLIDKVREMSKDMTALIVIFEQNKQTFWYCAGIEPAQAILSLDQLHHRIQHEGLNKYD